MIWVATGSSSFLREAGDGRLLLQREGLAEILGQVPISSSVSKRTRPPCSRQNLSQEITQAPDIAAEGEISSGGSPRRRVIHGTPVPG